MCAVVIRSNLSSPDLLGYFSSQWSLHSASQSDGWLTDMKLVGREGEAWGSVQVHRAVILPLCPLLGFMERDVTKEDPTVILPNYPVQLIQAFTNLIYKGSTPTSAVVTVTNILELMANLGLNMPQDRLVVTREESREIEMVGFKNLTGLEISKVNRNNYSTFQPIRPRHLHSVARSSPVSSGSPAKPHCLSKIVQTPIAKRKLRLVANSRKTRSSKKQIETFSGKDDARSSKKQIETFSGKDDADKKASVHEDVLRNSVEIVPVEVKIECEEFLDFQPTTTKKRKWSRRRETLEIPTHACDLCDFKCRFFKDLQEHCDLFHSDKELSCPKCEFKTNGLMNLKAHKKKKHVGSVDLKCEVCGFKASSKRKLTWHKTSAHELCHSELKEKSKINDSQDSLNLHGIGDQTLEDLNVETDGETVALFETSQSNEVTDAITGTEKISAKTRLENMDSTFSVLTSEQLELSTKISSETSDACEEVTVSVDAKVDNLFNYDEDENKDSNPNSDTNIRGNEDSFVTSKVDDSNMFENIENLLQGIPIDSNQDVERKEDGEIDMFDDLENDTNDNMIDVTNVEVKLPISTNEVVGLKQDGEMNIIDDMDNETNNNMIEVPNVEEKLPSSSNEVVAFKCSVPGCFRVFRVKYTTATHALNRLKNHHTKVHNELGDDEFSYEILFKEDTKDVEVDKLQEKLEENPLQILKKLKENHKRDVAGSSTGSDGKMKPLLVNGTKTKQDVKGKYACPLCDYKAVHVMVSKHIKRVHGTS